jgi:hypothetical protein
MTTTTTQRRSFKAPGQPGISRRSAAECEAAPETRFVRALCGLLGLECWTQLRTWYNLPSGPTEGYDDDSHGPGVRGYVLEMWADDIARLDAAPGLRDGLHWATAGVLCGAPAEDIASAVAAGLAGDDLRRAIGVTVFVARHGRLVPEGGVTPGYRYAADLWAAVESADRAGFRWASYSWLGHGAGQAGYVHHYGHGPADAERHRADLVAFAGQVLGLARLTPAERVAVERIIALAAPGSVTVEMC